MRTHLLTLLVFLLALSVHAADKLIVGMELAYPPFEMRDNAGDPTGVSVDLAKALGAHLGRPVEIENIPFSGLIPALKTGKIDLAISSMTATPERAVTIDFSDPYLKTGLCLVVPVGSDIQSVLDLDRPGRTVAVVKGTTGHLYASQKLKHTRVLVFTRAADCVLEVAQKKSDAFLIDQWTALENARRTPDTLRAILQPFQEESWAIGLRKSRDKLREEVNAFLKHYRESGGFDRLGEKWLNEQKAEFKKRGVTFVF